MSKQTVVFFAPYAGIWPHAYPEALVASALKQAGENIVYAVCDGMFADGCVVMTAHRLTPSSPKAQREAICQMCRKRRDVLVAGLGATMVKLDDFLPLAERERIANVASTVEPEQIVDFVADGQNVGRIALHETIIHFKLTSLEEMKADSLADFRFRLMHVMFSLHATQAMLRTTTPDRIVAYNTNVSTNYVMMLEAERSGVPTFGLHAGGNMDNRFASLYVFRKNMALLYKDWMARFESEWAALPTTARGIELATRHFLALTSGKTLWVYSEPKKNSYFDARAHYGVQSGQKLILATLSSYDELYSSQMTGLIASPELMFSTQVEWMQELIDHVAKRTDLFLVIRVHPRELPNLRDKIHSNHAKRLAVALANLPPNVKVNWPEERISLYDLLPHVDVGLNGWSSTGKEMALLGIPVVIFTGEILFYPASLNILASTKAEYFTLIDDACKAAWSFERIRQVFRWLAVEYTLGTINISDGFTYKEGARSLYRRIIGRLRRMFAYRFEARQLGRSLHNHNTLIQTIINEQPLVDTQAANEGRLSEDAEKNLILQQINILVDRIYNQVPTGASVTIDAIRKAVKTDGS